MSKKPTVLLILDGYGLSDKVEGNAVAQANTPVMDKLMTEYPFVKGYASGMAVGLPDGQMGNSEVGHLNMGAGRIVYQELTKITKAIEDGDFFTNKALLSAVENCKKNNSDLHLFGLLSTGGVHSHLGHIFALLKLAKDNGVNIYPVDSEHSAIFQSLNGEYKREVERILLTASGGPFRGKKRAELAGVTLEDALNHPNWAMGRKITIDSSTMVNKGLEVMEAQWLFDVPSSKVCVVVQPQSIIHSMVEFVDGGIMAQLGSPDMRLPIQYALYYPHRKELNTKRVDFFELGQITFEKPDMDTFKGLKLAYEASDRGGNIPTAFNAANELAVAKFLDRKIKYLDIPDIIEYAMNEVDFIDNPSVDEILDTEKNVYEMIGGKW